jgi:EAL domain-containing protein (putative c-di-GMP-specific phosphodiesterase class I)
MAKSLGLTVLAGGVENEQTALYLGDSHCNEAQGFYYGEPLTVSQFEENITALHSAKSSRNTRFLKTKQVRRIPPDLLYV